MRAKAALTVTGAVVTLAPHVRRVAAKVAELRQGEATLVEVVRLATTPRVTCRRCGQPLSDVVGAIQNFGYGPTCITRVA